MKLTNILLVVLLLCSFVSAQQIRGRWKCTALDAQTLALTGDYTEIQQELFRKRFEQRDGVGAKFSKWAQDFNFYYSGTEAIAQFRPKVVRSLEDSPKVIVASDNGGINVIKTGSWLSPIGEARFPYKEQKERVSPNADVAHFLFLQLERPLANGESVTITMPLGEKVAFTYDESTPTALFRINQVGYMPNAKKYAYVGAWLGTAGAMPLFERLDGKPFSLVNAENGNIVFSGKLKRRMDDPTNANGSPFTGEEVLELNFSTVREPGRYYLAVENLGRSGTFEIGDRTMAEAFYVHARGLFHQRCGIERKEPYTHWTAPACHLSCVRGTFPPSDSHYGKSDEVRSYGFFDSKGKSIDVKHFELIKQNRPEVPEQIPVCGGWHDAADWDRRPYHLGIVGDLCAVYLLKPKNFCDGQLNIPESCNGIPDILDEAMWGIEHLRLMQQPDGGVGTWIETTRHPGPSDGGSWQDKLTYYLSCATLNSTLEYAGYASEMALALRKAGAMEKSEQYRVSAERAWAYAHGTTPKPRVYHYDNQMITYREKTTLSPEFLVKAGLNLFLLNKDKTYLYAAEDAADAALKSMHKNSWRWSPFFWVELEFERYNSIVLDKLRANRSKALLKEAETFLQQQENNYPIRIAWYGPREGWVHTMSWGTYHPLRRARLFVMAHAITKDRDFLNAAYLANDFNNGANPSGSSMTSGLGKVYPVRFLDLNSYADGIAEFMPGITPYRNTYGVPRNAIRFAFGLFYPERPQSFFGGLSMSLLPREGLSEEECVKAVAQIWPIWHRWGNVEGETVAASEFTVWETIGPAAAVTGYLLNKAQLPEKEWVERKPADDIKKLPGYDCLP